MEWLIKKRKAFDQRGDMAIAAWAEQQQREMNIRVRRLSRSKVLFMHYIVLLKIVECVCCLLNYLLFILLWKCCTSSTQIIFLSM